MENAVLCILIASLVVTEVLIVFLLKRKVKKTFEEVEKF